MTLPVMGGGPAGWPSAIGCARVAPPRVQNPESTAGVREERWDLVGDVVG